MSRARSSWQPVPTTSLATQLVVESAHSRYLIDGYGRVPLCNFQGMNIQVVPLDPRGTARRALFVALIWEWGRV
jgi:hypothetical protein